MPIEVIKWKDNKKGYQICKSTEPLTDGYVYQEHLNLLSKVRDISSLPSIIKIGANLIDSDENKSTNTLYDIKNGKIETGNLIGVINTPADVDGNSIRIEISSRFDNFGRNYFLMYLLNSLWGYDIFDRSISVQNETSFDAVLCVLFLFKLKVAYDSGLYKVYETYKHNDFNFKGAFDISRHIKINTPFIGKTAYSTREYTYDNDILCMIRQTIDTIQLKYENLWNHMVSIDPSLNEIIDVISMATPSYQMNKQYQFSKQCMNRISHPLYIGYEDVRLLGQRILRDEGDNIFENAEEDSFALIIDMSWLWEEFVAQKLLNDSGYIHIINNGSKNGLYYSNDKSPWYPDFLENKESNQRRNIIDAKYKRWNFNSSDMHQLISYLFITGGTKCGAIFPVEATAAANDNKFKSISLNPFGKFYDSEVLCYKLPFVVPSYDESTSFEEYVNSINGNISSWKMELLELFKN